MKLHLPVRLFRAVMASLTLIICDVTSSLYAAALDGDKGSIITLAIASEVDHAYTLDSRGDTLTLSDTGSLTFNGYQTNTAGGAIYALSYCTITLCDNGSVSFSKNEARTGGAIDGGRHSSITLNNNESLRFGENSARNGGAIYFHGSTEVNGNEYVTFNGNTATTHGGAIYAEAILGNSGSALTLHDNESVVFSKNSAGSYGGAIYGLYYNSSISLSNNRSVQFSENTAANGGAICGFYSNETELYENVNITFSKNTAEEGGGAICVMDGSEVRLSFNKNVTVSENTAAKGGAICGLDGSGVQLAYNENVSFYKNISSSENKNTSAEGGAVYSAYLLLYGNEEVTFSDNSTSCSSLSSFGGAIYASSTIYIHTNKRISFNQNHASGSTSMGGAIHCEGNITLADNGSVSFIGNTATASDVNAGGGAIDGSVTMTGNGDVTFSGNKVSSTSSSAYGGAIYGSTITLSNNGSVEFCGNSASSSSSYAHGGAIDGDTITLSDNESVTFSENKAIGVKSSRGGAIYAADRSVLLNNNDSVIFIGNIASSSDEFAYGGAIYGDNSTITLSNNGSVTFSENQAIRVYSSFGGAIYGVNGTTITLSSNGSVEFCGNTASRFGGAIWGNGDISLSNNSSVIFSGNTATLAGGAIFGRTNSTVTLSKNRSVVFEGNTVSFSDSSTYGGAINGPTIILNNNGSVEFCGNSASSSSSYACGGAIEGDTITLSDNESVTFSGNTASSSSYAYGGAIVGDVTMTGNGDVSFSGNTASSSSSYGYGGAIVGSAVTMTGNGDVSFSGNTASSSSSYGYGGAIVGDVTMTGNGDVSFSGNTASSTSSSAYGGAIYGSVTMTGNGDVTFSGNTASGSSLASGGAIYARGSLNIRNNDAVEFAGNVEKTGSVYRLRSVYAVGGDGYTVSFSAAEGKSIKFRDSVHIVSGSTVNLNADYTYLNEAGESATIKQKGDIIFTGATTEADLLAVKGSAGTEKEILNSRTTEVNTMTNLFGGRLCVEDGAVYKGYGITAHEGSDSTIRVKDAELNHAGYDITLNSGTTLELEGENKITTSNLVMQNGSSLHFILDGTENHPAMTLTGNLSLLGAVSLQLDREMDYGVYQLMTCSSISGDISQLTADIPEHYELAWSDNALNLIVWESMQLTDNESDLNLSRGAVKAVTDTDLGYRSVTLRDGLYQISGEGSLGVSEVLSVTGGADVTLDLATVAAGVEVGDDSSLSLQKGLNLVSLMTLDDETEAAKAISVGRNAELSLTDAALLGQVAMADETSAVYYQTETGDKLLKFTGDLGNGGLNLTLGEDGRTVRATDSAGFTGNITVLTGTTLVNDSATATDGLAFGANYATAPDKTITVQEDATLDINGRETYYHLVLEEMSVLKNSGADAHHDWKGIPAIDLQGDAEVIADAQICMVGAAYGATSLNLNGHTLYKNGEAALVLRNTAINAGTLAVEQGMIRFMGDTSTAAGTALDVSYNGTLWISEGTGTYAGTLKIGTGGRVYLGEPPQGTMGGDHETNNHSMSLAGLSELELAGGTLTFRGTSVQLGSVSVTADSVLEIWDQIGTGGEPGHYSSVASMHISKSAELTLATTWKSALNIAALAGDGVLKVGSSRQVHRVTVGDISGYSGVFEVAGSSSLTLTLGDDDVLDSSRVTMADGGQLKLSGAGVFRFSGLEGVDERAAAPSFLRDADWQGRIQLEDCTASGIKLNSFAAGRDELLVNGVSGWFMYGDGVQPHIHLQAKGLTVLDNSKKTYTYLNGISGTGDFVVRSKSAYESGYEMRGAMEAWSGAFRVQQSTESANASTVNLSLNGGGTLFDGSDGSGVYLERTGTLNVTIGHADTASILKGDILNVGVTNGGTTTFGSLNVSLNHAVEVQGNIQASSMQIGAGADISFAGTVQADRWSVGKDAYLCLGTGAVVYLSEAPNGVMEGDVQTDDRGTLELTEATVELAGGRLSYRGKNMAMGEVNVTSDSVLEIWDQIGKDGVATNACTIDSLNLDAALTQTTTWKCTLEIGSLTGSGPLTVSSRNEKHYVTLNDLSEYTGTVSISGANTTLTLNMVKDAVVNASLVTKDNTSHLVLKGQGSYNIGTARSLAAGVCFAEDWEGSVRLTGTMAGETLSGLNQESSWVELFGVSGYLSQADAAAGAQTYGMNLKLTDAGETAAWNLNNGWNGDVRTFTGMVCGTGTLNRNHYRGTEQTLIFAGDVSGWSGALEHNATSATNNGQKVKTNVTFNGSSEINVAMRTNGKGELNVTLDDANLAAGSKVTVNSAIEATNLTVTEGTTVCLANEVELSNGVVLKSQSSSPAELSGVDVSASVLAGNGSTARLADVWMEGLAEAYGIRDVAMQNVHFSAGLATLSLSNVSFDDSCSFSVGADGIIILSDAMLQVTMPAENSGRSELLVNLGSLFQCHVQGELSINLDAATLLAAGYTTVKMDFGQNAAEDYSQLLLKLDGAAYTGMSGNVASFNLVPEPATTTLSLLALTTLAMRRRRR